MRRVLLVALALLALTVPAAAQDFPSGSLATLIDAKVDLGESGSLQLYGRYSQHQFYVRCDGTCSSGAVVIEAALDTDYAGAWANLATVSLSTDAVTKVDVVSRLAAVRARISTAVGGGGTTTVVYLNLR